MEFDIRTFTIGGLNLVIKCDYSDHKFICTLLEAKSAYRKLGDAIRKIELRDKRREAVLDE